MSKEEQNQLNSEAVEENLTSDDLAAAISKAALAGNFNEADALRERLIKIDPVNLKLIVSTGEIIEDQKTKLLDKDHLAVWDALYGDLTEEESNGLFYSMESALLDTNKLLQVQGKISNRLFFIDNGKVALFYRKDGKNMIAAQLGRGDIVGESSFFEISLCPLSAATQAETKLYSLTRSAAEAWQEVHPGLYEKVAEFCRKQGKSGEAIAANELDRRSTRRHPISGVAGAVVLQKDGSPGANRFKGGLSDISQSGLCFDIKCSRQETARALLAAEVELALEFDERPQAPLQIKGQITKVGFHLHNDYSVHVKFIEPIAESTFKTLPCQWPEDEESDE
ncbi:MAG: cyclic nucleotide-binding domain-containing protein [Desulfofustis sp.]|nr:cyclic nucleotide-binding domain-containing protein [Desulfofustis sp.]